MRIGKDTILNQIGKTLLDCKFQSCLIEEEIVDNFNLIFLNFDNDWIQITTEDGSAVRELPSGISNIEDWIDEKGNKFSYPISSLKDTEHEIVSYFGLKFISLKELQSKYSEEICGIKFAFENDKTIVINTDVGYDTHFNFNSIIPENLIEK